MASFDSYLLFHFFFQHRVKQGNIVHHLLHPVTSHDLINSLFQRPQRLQQFIGIGCPLLCQRYLLFPPVLAAGSKFNISLILQGFYDAVDGLFGQACTGTDLFLRHRFLPVQSIQNKQQIIIDIMGSRPGTVQRIRLSPHNVPIFSCSPRQKNTS